MFRKITSAFMALLLALAITSAPVYAVDTSLILSQSTAAVGDSVTASGQSDAETWISIKILDSEQSIVFYNAIKSDNAGIYTDTFTVPDVESGILNVIAGYGTNVTSQNLTVTTSSGSGTGTGSGTDTGTGTGDGTGAGLNSDQSFTCSFSTVSRDPDDTVLRFDFSNGIDQNLPDCLGQIHVYTKSGNTAAEYADYNYIKQGSNAQPDVPKLRRLELTFDNLEAGTTYVVEIDDDFAANNGNSISGTTKWQFTTTGTAVVSGTATGTNQTITAAGGEVSDDDLGAVITIPRNAFGEEIEVTLEELSDTSGLPLQSFSKFIGKVIEINKDVTGNFSKPVTISLSFDPDEIDQDKYRLSIYWLDETANQWMELENVEVDIKTGTVSGAVTHFTKFAVIVTEKNPVVVSLNDIAGHWAQGNVEKLVAMGAITGYPDGSFKPDANITRAEFATVLVKAFGLETESGKVFEDTANSWARDYIATANAYGIVDGYNDQLFGPDDLITREQMVKMAVKAAQLVPETGTISFADSTNISDWAVEAIATAVKNGIISGYSDNTVRPGNGASRAEAVTIIFRALQ